MVPLFHSQESRRSDQFLAGRCDGNVRVLFPKVALTWNKDHSVFEDVKPGDYVAVEVYIKIIPHFILLDINSIISI